MAQVTMRQRLPFVVATLVLLLMAAQGVSSQQRCPPSAIDVQQSNTGKKTGTLDTVFQVTVTNRCRCAVKAVLLRADGFTSSIAVDPKLFRQAGAAGYLVGDGRRIANAMSVTFQYAWDHYFRMTPSSVQAEC